MKKVIYSKFVYPFALLIFIASFFFVKEKIFAQADSFVNADYDVTENAVLETISAPPLLTLASGNNRITTERGSEVSLKLEVSAWSGMYFEALPDIPVTFSVLSGSGLLSEYQGGPLFESITVYSGNDGYVNAYYAQPNEEGHVSVIRASVDEGDPVDIEIRTSGSVQPPFFLRQNVISSSLLTLPAQDKIHVWLRADMGVVENEGFISRWGDQSGNNRNAVQLYSYYPSPVLMTNVLNGNPVVSFTYTDSEDLYFGDILSGKTEGEIFVVLRALGVNSGRDHYLWNFGNVPTYYPDRSGKIREGFFSSQEKQIGLPPIDISQWHIYNLASKKGLFDARFNGQLHFRSDNTVRSYGNKIGGGFDGDIAEVIIYEKILTSEERNAVGRYLVDKYDFMNLPEVPAGLSVKAVSGTQTLLSWDREADVRYVVERKCNTGTYEFVAEVDAASYIDSGLELGQIYSYRLKARNYAGDSVSGAEETVMLGYDEAAMPLDSISLWLRADDSALGALNYWNSQGSDKEVFARAMNSVPPDVIVDEAGVQAVHFDASKNQYLSVRNILLNKTEGEVFAIVQAKSNMPPNGRGLWNFGGSESSFPNYDGNIKESFGLSGSQNFSVGGMDLCEWNIYNVSAKSGLWESRMNGRLLHQLSGYSFYSANIANISLGMSSMKYFDGYIAEILVYDRMLSTTERAGVGRYLAVKYGMSSIPFPAKPSSVTAKPVGNQVYLSWNGGGNNESYIIERRLGNGSYAVIASVEGRTSFVDENLPAGSYTYRVRASNYAGDSGYSDLFTVVVSGENLIVKNELVLWLRADTESLGVSSLWSDYSGKGNHARQMLPSSRPQVVANAVNGFPAARFNGSSYFSLSNALSGSTEAEVFIALKANQKSGTNRGLWTWGRYGTYYPASNGSITEGFSLNSQQDLGAPMVDIDRWHLYNISAKAGEWEARQNGLSFYRNTNPTLYFNMSELGAYSTTRFDGDIAEVLVYKRVLSPQERGSIGRYFSQKYEFESMPVPQKPSGFVAKTLLAGEVALSWSPQNGMRYIVERKSDSGEYEAIADLERQSYFVDKNVTSGTTYQYRVKASNYRGESAYSDAVAATLAGLSALPQGELALWLRADMETPGRLSVWRDQSGNARNVTQNTNAAKPELQNGSMGAFPFVKFNETQYFSVPKLTGTVYDVTVFAVLRAKTAAPTKNRILWKLGNGETHYPNTSGLIYDYTGSTSSKNVTPTVNLADWSVYSVCSQQNRWEAYLNGESVHQTSSNAAYVQSSSYLGYYTANSFEGDIAEIIIYNRVLNENEHFAVGQYLSRKYGLPFVETVSVPSGLNTNLGHREVTLNWSGGSNPAGTKYVMERKQQGGEWEKIAETTGLTYVDKSVLSGKDYEYRIRSVVNGVESDYSDIIAVSTPGLAPKSPENLSSSFNDGVISLFWTDGRNDNDVQYIVERRKAGETWEQLAITGDLFYNDSAIYPEGVYEYRVYALIEGFSSGASDVFAVTVPEMTVPWTPKHLSILLGAADSLSNRVTLLWEPLENFDGYYIVERNRNVISNPDENVWETVSYQSWAGFLDICASILPSYRVTAVNDYGQSVSAVIESVQINDVPEHLKAVVLSRDSVKLTWSSASPVSIERRANGGAWEEIATVMASAWQGYVDQGLSIGVNYEYRACMVANPWPAEYTNTAAITIRELENVNKFAVPLDGMRLWLQGDRGVSVYMENGVQFVKWADQSGVNFHIISGTGGVAPLSSDGGNIGVSFSQRAGQKAMLFPGAVFEGANNFDVFVVSKRFNNGKLFGFLGGMVKQNVDIGEPYTFFVGDLPVGFPQDMPRGRNTHIYNLSKNTESAAVRVDGLVLREERPAVFDGLFSGGIYMGDGFDGYVQEIIVFDRSLGGDERKAVESYLRKKYGLYTYTGVSVLKPTDLKSFSVSKTQLHLAWNGSLDEGTVYVIERSTDGTNYAKIAEVAGLSYIDSGLEPGRNYSYRIYGKGGFETSVMSDILSTKTDSQFDAQLPLSALRAWFKADAGSARYVVHSWKSQAGFASGIWEGMRYVWTGVHEETLHDSFERYSYTHGPLHLSDELHAGISSGELVSVMRQGAFGIRIGGHDFVNQDDFLLGHEDYKMVGTLFTPAKQEYYENGLKTRESNEGIVLEKEPGRLGYGSYASEIMLFERPLTEAERAVVSVYLGKRYRLDIGKLPERPYDLESEAINDSQVTLNWSGNHGGTHGIRYIIERRKENGEWEFVEETTNFTFVDSDLDAETNYSYRVRAEGFAGSSDFSFETTVKTAKTSEDFAPIPFDEIRLWLKGANNPVAPVVDLSDLHYGVQGKSSWDNRLNAWAMTKAEVVNGGSIMTDCNEGELFMVLPSENYSPTNFNFGQSANSRIYNRLNTEDYERYITFSESFGRGNAPVSFETLQSHAPAGPMLYNVSADATEWKVRVNGREVKALPAASSPRFTSSSRIFAEVENGEFESEWSIRFSEVMLFKRALTEAERASVNRYLSAKNAMGIVGKLQSLEDDVSASYEAGSAILRWRGGNAAYYTIERGFRNPDTGVIYWWKIATLRNGVNFFVDEDGYYDQSGCFYRITAHDNYGNTSSEIVERPAHAEDTGELPNDILLWLKADEGVNYDEENRVSHWSNTGSGRVGLYQKSYQLMPKRVENAVNGKPAIRFDGSMAWMNVPAFDDNQMRIEVIAVVRESGAIDKDTILMVYGQNLLHEEYPNGLGRLIGNGFKIFDSTVPEFMSGADYITRDTLGLGFKGDIAELIIYKRDSLNSAQRAQILRDLEQKYALVNHAQGAQVADNNSHRLVIKPDGTLWANGSNAYGQLGNGQVVPSGSQKHYTRVGNLQNVISVATGATYSLALTADGSLYAFGSFNYDGAGRYYTTYSNPQRIAGNVYAISRNMYFSSGGVYWWRDSELNKLYRAPINGSIKQVVSGPWTYMVLFTNGNIFAWTSSYNTIIGPNTQLHPNFAEGLSIYSASIELGAVKQIDNNGGSMRALMEDGSVYAWGSGFTSTPTQMTLSGLAKDIRANGPQTRILFEDGHCQDITHLGNENNQYSSRYSSPSQIHAIGNNTMIRKDGAVLSNNGDTAECIIVSAEDSDNDGLPDSWEMHYFGNLTTASDIDDSDNDGLKNFEEYYRRTNPLESDNGPWPSDNWVRNNPWKKNVYLRPLIERFHPRKDGATIPGNQMHYRNSTWHFWVNNDYDEGGVNNKDWKGYNGDSPNWADFKINGEKDITDFFPVWIDLSTFFGLVNELGSLPEDWEKLSIHFSQDDFAFNAIPYFFENNELPYKSVDKIKALLPHRLYWITNGRQKSPVFTISKGMNGYERGSAISEATMTVGFDYWKNLDISQHKFGLLLEANFETTKPIVMEIKTKSGKLLYRTEFPVAITDVTKMYRHHNVVDAINGEIGDEMEVIPGYESRPEATNFPDVYNDRKNFIFVHGFNVNQGYAEGGHNELFKNLFWSGSRMKFHGFTWFGNYDRLVGEFSVIAAYQFDVVNAFKTSYHLAGLLKHLKSLGDRVVVGGHSLGNMVVSAAIQDHEARPDIYLMLNAAVAKEAYDANEEDLSDKASGKTPGVGGYYGMEHFLWRMRDRDFWASYWYRHWKNVSWMRDDFRSKLTWQGRFGNIKDYTKMYSYYSSGEEVLCAPSADIQLDAWNSQEHFKGRLFGLFLENYGGWSTDSSRFPDTVRPWTELGSKDLHALRTAPGFDEGPSFLHEESFMGSLYAEQNEAELLAKFVPAVSFAAGGNGFEKNQYFIDHSIDINEVFQLSNSGNPIWPQERIIYDEQGNPIADWFHSDLKDVAYPYIYKLYEDILERENSN